MKVKYKHNQLIMLPDNPDEDQFCKLLIRRMTDSNRLMGWYGDVEFDGKETSGYKIAMNPKPSKGIPAGKKNNDK